MKIYLETSVIVVKLFGASSEQERYRYPFVESLIMDASDQPHATTAALSGCHAIVTYDSHFDAIENRIVIHTPESFLWEFAG